MSDTTLPILSLGVIGTSRKPDERRVPIHPAHLERLPELRDLRARWRRGYGERFGLRRGTASLVGGVASRDDVIAAGRHRAAAEASARGPARSCATVRCCGAGRTRAGPAR